MEETATNRPWGWKWTAWYGFCVLARALPIGLVVAGLSTTFTSVNPYITWYVVSGAFLIGTIARDQRHGVFK